LIAVLRERVKLLRTALQKLGQLGDVRYHPAIMQNAAKF
jgi:hypothetical protein